MFGGMKIGGKILLPSVLLFVCMVTFGLYFLSHMVRHNTLESGLSDAVSTIEEIRMIRKYYTTNVVAKIKANIDDATFDAGHKGSAHAFPAPATLVHDISEELSSNGDGKAFKMYSPYPFSNRTQRQMDDFGREAWDYMKSNKDGTYSRVDEIGGLPVLRVAQADNMTAEGCVSCHNSHPDSRKTDWQLGDLRGLFEVIVPLHEQMEAANGYVLKGGLVFGTGGGLILIFLYFVVRRMVAPLSDAVDFANQLNTGDLTANRDVRSNDETGELTRAMNGMASSFHSIIQQVASTSRMLTSSTDEISGSNRSIAADAAAQNDALRQLAEMMDEIETSTHKTADATAEARQLSLEAHQKAENGDAQMRKMLESINGISDSSQSISEIINTIEQIAFQTNLLAINASVEAARAGEDGKGFAVVAMEVRNLALRSSDAARETADLIEDSVSRVKAGAAIAATTADTLDEIKKSSTEVSELINRISEATRSQANRVVDVNEKLTQLGSLSAGTAGNSERAAGISQQLSGQADKLLRLVSRFRVVESSSYR